jgi:hypothetical protein
MMGNVHDHDAWQSSHGWKITDRMRSADDGWLRIGRVIPRSGEISGERSVCPLILKDKDGKVITDF